MFHMDPFDLIVRAIVLLTAIPVHEAAHAYVADKLGDPTARYMGRLTLNPMAHLDLMGSISLIFLGIGWAKPVPINPMNFEDRKKGMAISAAAGPISNLVIALFSLMISKVIMYSSFAFGYNWVLDTLHTIFITMCSINITLAIFNLMPFPPFDGSRIFNYFMSDKLYFKIMEHEQTIFMVVFVLLMFGVLDAPLNFLVNFAFSMLNKLTFFIDIIFRAIL